MKNALAVLALLCVLTGCGGDGVFIISFTSGIIEGDPVCRTNGGEFDLRDQGGLTVLVVLTSSSTIVLANGNRGTCRDLSANTSVTVRGPQQAERITAQTVTVQ